MVSGLNHRGVRWMQLSPALHNPTDSGRDFPRSEPLNNPHRSEDWVRGFKVQLHKKYRIVAGVTVGPKRFVSRAM